MNSVRKSTLILIAAGTVALAASAVWFFSSNTGTVEPAPPEHPSGSAPVTARQTEAQNSIAGGGKTANIVEDRSMLLRAGQAPGSKLTPRTPQPKVPLIQPEGNVLQLSVKFMDSLKARSQGGRLSVVAAAVPA